MTGLVLEGGARRCMFTAGILDTFAREHIRFDYVIGVSAGAQTALNFVSGQLGRAARNMMPSLDDLKVSSVSLRSQVARELTDRIYPDAYGMDPFDFSAYFASPVICELTASCCETGETMYFQERTDEKRLLDMLCASCSLPILFPEIEIDGLHYLDGSLTDSVPFERAFAMGCDRAVVILTKTEAEAPTDYGRMRPLLSRQYGTVYPRLYEALLVRASAYATQQQALTQAEQKGKVLVLRPGEAQVRAFDPLPEHLRTAYKQGEETAEAALADYKAKHPEKKDDDDDKKTDDDDDKKLDWTATLKAAIAEAVTPLTEKIAALENVNSTKAALDGARTKFFESDYAKKYKDEANDAWEHAVEVNELTGNKMTADELTEKVTGYFNKAVSRKGVDTSKPFVADPAAGDDEGTLDWAAEKKRLQDAGRLPKDQQ